MLGRKNKEQVEKDAIDKRIDKLATPDLISWADQALFGIGRTMSDWERYKTIDSLKEAALGAEALLKVLNTIVIRTENEL